MNDSDGQPLCIGSGFFVSDDVVATNAHVIQGAGSGSAKLVGQGQTFQVLGALAVDAHADLALLKVSGKAPSLGLSRGPAPVVGDHVYVIGNPLGLEGTFSEGIVSGLRTTGMDSLIQMTAPISPGSSGGPVMDAAGEVIGVAVATFKEGQNLNLAVPVAYLERMLEAHPAALAPLQSASPRPIGSSSIIDGLGTRAEEGVIATDFRMDQDLNFSYKIRLTNRLPVAVSKITVVVIFFDSAGKMLDFDQWTWQEAIPAGLTKDAWGLMSGRDVYKAVSETLHNGHYNYKTEVRVIGFKTGETQY
jgi:S1-C subfamily serine protease